MHDPKLYKSNHTTITTTSQKPSDNIASTKCDRIKDLKSKIMDAVMMMNQDTDSIFELAKRISHSYLSSHNQTI